MRRIVAVAVVCVLPLVVSGQSQPQTPQATFRAGIDVVRLDVSVLDKSRRPVRGLTTSDFTVLENGKPQPIVAFSEVDIPDAEEPPAPWMREVASDVATNQLDTRRVVIIVMDDGTTESDPGTGKFGRQIAREVIDRLGPNDLAAVVFTYLGRAQNFTSDHRQLIAATESFIPKFGLQPDRMSAAAPSRTSTPVPRMLGGAPLGCSLRGRRGCLTDTLKNVSAALADSPAGRKTLVLVSSARMAPNFAEEALEAADDMDDLAETFRNLQRANVNIYAFDPSGLTVADGIIAPRLDMLRVLSENTGGRAVVATNTPWEGVPAVFRENSSYYLLGIRSTNTAQDGRFRRLSVKVGRPEVDVRTRVGYFAPKATRPSKKAAAPVTALDKAFGASLPTGALPLELGIAPFRSRSGKQAILAIVIGTRRPVTNEVANETIELVTTAFDTNFKPRGTQRQTIEISLRPHASGERRVELPSRLDVPPGRYEVRVGAESPGGAGGVFAAVDVPDFTKSGVWLSGLVVGVAVAGHPAGGTAFSDLLPVVPTLVREYGASDSLEAFLRVYQGGKDEPVAIPISGRIKDAENRVVFEDSPTLSADRFRADRSADYRLPLPLARLSPGQYLLTIEAVTRGKTVSRDVRFRVGQRLANEGRLDDAMQARSAVNR